MKHGFWPLAFAAAFLTTASVSASSRVDHLILRFRSQQRSAELAPEARAQRLESLRAATGFELQFDRVMSGQAELLRLPQPLSLEQAQAAADRLSALPEVLYAAPDARMQVMLQPNDPRYDEQWHYFENYGVGLPEAWETTTGSLGVVVAVLDTGIRPHVDFGNRILPGYDMITHVPTANDGNGRDSNAEDPGDWMTVEDTKSGDFGLCSPEDSSWHGTHTAGTIGAIGNNGLGVAGVNWVSPILPVRVLGKCGGVTSDILDGMRWAAGLPVPSVPDNPNPARVLNLSLGGFQPCDAATQSAINDVLGTGAVVVVSAGNFNADVANFAPANCNGVLTVAATNRAGGKASYSNFGAKVEISAPGGDTDDGVLSTLNSGKRGPQADSYAAYVGTSMAAPHVAGIVSLLLSIKPSLTNEQALDVLQDTARSFGGSSCTTATCGAGIVDAAAALASIEPDPPTSPTPTRTPRLTPTVTPTPGKPGQPQIRQVEIEGPVFATLYWKVGEGTAPTGYKLSKSSTGGSPYSLVDTTPDVQTYYTGQLLQLDTSTYFRVTAVNDKGESPASRQVQIITHSLNPGANWTWSFVNEMQQDLEIQVRAFPANFRDPEPAGGVGPCEIRLEVQDSVSSPMGTLVTSLGSTNSLVLASAAAGTYSYAVRASPDCTTSTRYGVMTQPQVVLSAPPLSFGAMLRLLSIGVLAYSLIRRRRRHRD